MLPPQRRSSSRHDNGSRPQTLPRHSHAGSNRIPGSLPERLPGDVPGKVPLGVPPDQLSQWTGILEKVSEVKLLPMLNIILKHLLLSAIGFPYYNIFAKGKHFSQTFLSPGEHWADIKRRGVGPTWSESTQTWGKRPRGKVEDCGESPSNTIIFIITVVIIMVHLINGRVITDSASSQGTWTWGAAEHPCWSFAEGTLSLERRGVFVILFTMITIITNTWKFFMMSAIMVINIQT